MTVIAYRDGIMACDSLWTDDIFRSAHNTKMVKLNDNVVIGTSGDVDDRDMIEIFKKIEWTDYTLKDMPRPSEMKECEQELVALVATRNGSTKRLFVVTTGSSYSVHEVTMPFYAVGSGAHLAVGAMAHGATAAEATKISCQYDLHCAEPVHVLEV